MSDMEGTAPPGDGGITVILTSPGGVACKPFADGYAVMRVCLGLPFDAEDGLEAEVRLGRRPVPWESREVREEAIAELRRWAREAEAEGEDRAALVRLLEHVRRTPYYECA